MDLETDERPQPHQSPGRARPHAGGLRGGAQWISRQDELIAVNSTRT